MGRVRGFGSGSSLTKENTMPQTPTEIEARENWNDVRESAHRAARAEGRRSARQEFSLEYDADWYGTTHRANVVIVGHESVGYALETTASAGRNDGAGYEVYPTLEAAKDAVQAFVETRSTERALTFPIAVFDRPTVADDLITHDSRQLTTSQIGEFRPIFENDLVAGAILYRIDPGAPHREDVAVALPPIGGFRREGRIVWFGDNPEDARATKELLDSKLGFLALIRAGECEERVIPGERSPWDEG